MYKNKTLAVVVPAYNEERLIGKTVNTMPSFVDHMIVINDASTDNTLSVIHDLMKSNDRIILINHEVNKGVGQSLIDGYVKAREIGIDMVAVMAGDAQMNPDDLPAILDPIADGIADYTKGNRLLRDEVWDRMPRYRFFGNSGLTLLTKFATGYWHSIDPQCGYTALSKRALSIIPIEEMWQGYGYCADIMNMLNLNNLPMADVEVEPVYGEEVSTIKLSSYVPMVSKLLIRLFFKRLKRKYLVREFHPLIFFYCFSLLMFVGIALPYLFRFLYMWAQLGEVHTTMLIFLLNTVSIGLFSLFFAMWMDMEDNKKLAAFPHGTRMPLESHVKQSTSQKDDYHSLENESDTRSQSSAAHP